MRIPTWRVHVFGVCDRWKKLARRGEEYECEGRTPRTLGGARTGALDNRVLGVLR
jgi:hypothetical protein